jgi:hypothetical protein
VAIEHPSRMNISSDPAHGSGVGERTRQRHRLNWSAGKLAELRKVADATETGADGRVLSMLAAAQLRAAAGDFDVAEAVVLAVWDQRANLAQLSPDFSFALLETWVIVQRLDLAARMIVEQFEPGCPIELVISDPGPGVGLLVWDVSLPDGMRFTFDPSVIAADITHAQLLWFVWIFPIFATYAKFGPGQRGSVIFNQWDAGISPGLAMCDSRPGYFLVPCNAFVSSKGYQAARQLFTRNDAAWESRASLAFFRGATTGHPSDPTVGWRSLPRIRLCEIARSHPELFDAGISGIVQGTSAADREAIAGSGLMRPFVPITEFNRYKYQIDIDGYSNAWPGFFQKLLTGGPVLKVASPRGFRQWYYDRLRPWINFVPVQSDMSDLVEKVTWLRDHDAAARAIGEQGQALALSLEYDRELKNAIPTVTAALRYFAKLPETVLSFGTNQLANAYLRDGWFDPTDTGVPARGLESRMQLPRPIAPEEDFILTFDLSCHAEARPRPAQRVTIVANGEVLTQVVVTTRQTVDCLLQRCTIDAAESLTITLLHPVSVWSSTGRAVPAPTAAPGAVKPRRDSMLYGPEILLPPGAELRRLMTHHGSVVFADVSGGRLLHGPESASPANVLLARVGGDFYLLHVTPDGGHYSIRVPPGREGIDARVGDARVGDARAGDARAGDDEAAIPPTLRWIQSFRVVRIETDPASFALSDGDLFLCAEPDGRLTLSRSRIGYWEQFQAKSPTSGLAQRSLEYAAVPAEIGGLS